jgi:hypoxanthine-DNA glycosylase
VQVHSFAPVANASSRLLILGSMPGLASLRARQYYAHPRNAFWRIIGELYGIDPGAPYRARIAALLAERIALWDVLASCVREGSLDSDIDEASIVANPLADFLRAHPAIGSLCFNGAKAHAAYRKHVLPGLAGGGPPIVVHRLPSTSPANTSLTYPEKLGAWRAALPPRRGSPGRGRRRRGSGRCRGPSGG